MDCTYDEDVCCCTLNKAFGFRPKVAIALISNLGSASEVFRLSGKDLDRLLGKDSAARAMICGKSLSESRKELDSLYSQGCSFTYYGAKDYPGLLKECEDPPVGLYVKSVSSPDNIFRKNPAIAVVGTRDISDYGREWCRKITGSVCRAEPAPAIVSGLALGTDVTAHSTALEHGAPTIAVMATGIDSVYPARHAGIARRIASTPGCALITDYPPGTAPLQINFLRRNRIIAGLGRATLLIESKAKGGGMLTARLAFSYSRDVFALPGRIDDIRSQGCNILIKEKIAEPILSEAWLVQNIGLKLKDTGNSPDPADEVRSVYSGKFGKDKIGILAGIVLDIRTRRGITVEELAADAGLSYKETLEYTALLESDGIIYTDLQQRCYIRLK